MAAEGQPAGSGAGPVAARHGRLGTSGIAALLALAMLGGSFTWWALKYGAYFGTVLYPGAILLAAGTAVLLWTAPWRASLALSGAARLTLLALAALAVWTLASALWSPTPDVAIADAQRVVVYALAFGLGIWTCVLLGSRMELAMAPLVLAAAVAGMFAVLALLGGDDPNRLLEGDGTLDYPLGYRNANAAFFLIALWPALGLASSAAQHPAVRVGALATATLCVEIGILCQSRGAIVGALVAVVVYALAAPRRVRGLAWLVLAAIPALICLPAASDLYGAAEAGSDLVGVADEMSAAARAALLGLVASIAVAVLAVFLDRRLTPRRPAWTTPLPPRGRAAVAGATIALLAAGVVAFGSPGATWVGDRLEEFESGRSDFSGQSSRFTFNAGSNRADLWRVALDAGGDDPVFGEGAGGFEYRYTQEREAREQVARDAHSVWLEHLSELGVIGLALFAAAAAAAFVGALRARRLGPASAQVSCAALAAGAYWLTHSSLDWFWPYPALTAPALALLGSAVAPALLSPARTSSAPRGRLALLGVIVALAVTVVPPFVSEVFVNRAYDAFRVDPEGAYADLDRARFFNPTTDVPALAEGAIARELGQTEQAIESFREAARMRPREWAAHYFLALLYVESDPGLARTELAVVADLNPLSPRVDRLRDRIKAAERRGRRDDPPPKTPG